MRSEKCLAEKEENFMAGRIGYKCPFCNNFSTNIITEYDRQGIIDSFWNCQLCDESGPCLISGQPIYQIS